MVKVTKAAESREIIFSLIAHAKPCEIALQLMAAFASGVLSDFYSFNPITMTWKNLAGLVYGASPSPREGHGFASALGRIFVFGGENSAGVSFKSAVLCWSCSCRTIPACHSFIFSCHILSAIGIT
jgi:hypothetical protein